MLSRPQWPAVWGRKSRSAWSGRFAEPPWEEDDPQQWPEAWWQRDCAGGGNRDGTCRQEWDEGRSCEGEGWRWGKQNMRKKRKVRTVKGLQLGTEENNGNLIGELSKDKNGAGQATSECEQAWLQWAGLALMGCYFVCWTQGWLWAEGQQHSVYVWLAVVLDTWESKTEHLPATCTLLYRPVVGVWLQLQVFVISSPAEISCTLWSPSWFLSVLEPLWRGPIYARYHTETPCEQAWPTPVITRELIVSRPDLCPLSHWNSKFNIHQYLWLSLQWTSLLMPSIEMAVVQVGENIT